MSPAGNTTDANRLHGRAFEEIFEKRAQSNGLLPTKIPSAARFLYKGRIQVIKSDLDYRLIRRSDGRVGYFDCKCYTGSHFVHSDLSSDQVERAVLYNECRVPSGFVVWFRATDQVAFYSGTRVQELGPRTRFTVDNARLRLGTIQDFDLRPLMELLVGLDGRPVNP